MVFPSIRISFALAIAILIHIPNVARTQPAGSAEPGASFGLAAPSGAAFVTLAEAKARALASNPQLEAAVGGAEAAAGTARQARAWANPEIGFEAEEVGGDRPGWSQSELTWTLSQRLELFGTRGARTRAALHGRDAAALHADAIRLDLLAEVERRFARALATRSRLEALEAGDSLAAETVRAVGALVEAGEVSPIEIERAQAERSQVGTQLLAARVEHAGAIRALVELWGGRDRDVTGVRGSLEELSPLSGDEPTTSALPDLLAADAEVRRAQAEASLANRERLPELTVHAGLRRLRASSERTYVGGLGLTVPLLDRGGGRIDEARARLRQAEAEREALQSRLGLARATAADVHASALETARRWREENLPRAESIDAAVQEGYQRGKFGLLDLLDARRSLLEARMEYIDAMEAVWIARADLVRLSDPNGFSEEGRTR